MAINFGTGGEIQSGIPLCKVTKSFHHMVLQGLIKYFNSFIITTTRIMATKLGKIVTYYKELQPIKPHNPLNTWSHEVT